MAEKIGPAMVGRLVRFNSSDMLTEDVGTLVEITERRNDEVEIAFSAGGQRIYLTVPLGRLVALAFTVKG